MTFVLALALGCSPPPEDIAKAIRSSNPVMREDGAKIAQGHDDPVVIDALISVLADPSEKVRLNAIESLAELHAQAAVEPLRERLRADDSPAVRRAAADALGRLKAREAAVDLIAYVGGFGPDDRAQLAGVWALGSIGSEGLAPPDKAAALEKLVTLRETTTDRYVAWNATAALRTLR